VLDWQSHLGPVSVPAPWLAYAEMHAWLGGLPVEGQDLYVHQSADEMAAEMGARDEDLDWDLRR
jgi:hypothetical protein